MKFTPDPEIQFGTVAEIKAFQDRRLAETVGYLAGNSPFYMRLFAEKGIDPETIVSVEDLQRIPTVSKDDLQKYSRDFICVPEDDIVDYVTTSGTLGDPVTFALTDADLDRLAYNEWLSFSTAGCSRSDIMQLMTTIDRRFMAGLAYFLGARKMRMGIVRVGNGIPELQWDTIRRVRPDCCMVVPSFLMKLVGYARENGIDYRGSSLRKAICIGEALQDPDTFGLSTLGRRIHEVWPELELYSTYASTEMQSSFTECHCHCGCHIPVDLIIVELLDRDGNHVPDGQPGEVTVTTLGVEGMPLLRFRTGDICRMYDEPCSCGRNSPRLSSVIGRRSQMVKFKGTTLYPPALFDVLDSIPEITNYIVEVYTNDLGTDEVLVRIGCEDHSDAFLKKVKDMFRSRVRVAPTISFEKADYIAKLQMPPMSRKAVKFIDMR